MIKNLNIVIIGGAESSDVIITGGVQSVVHNLVGAFKEYPKTRFFLLDSKTVKRIKDKNIIYDNLPLVIPRFGVFFNLIFFRRRIVKRIETNYKPDLYHFQGTVPNLLFLEKSIRRKSVITQHGILREEFKYQTNIFKKIKFSIKILIENLLFHWIENIIYISEYNKNLIQKEFPMFRPKNSKLIYNPVDSIYYRGSKFDINNKKLYFLGEVKKRKGLHDLLRVIENLNDKGLIYSLDVIGGFKEKDYQKYILNLVKNGNFEDRQVVFHDWKSTNEIIDITQDCSIFVLPSYQETLPVSIAEAMAMGKLVVATNLPGIAEMVDNGKEGILFSKGNINELENILIKIWKEKINMTKLRVNAYEKSKKMFSSNAIAENTIKFYKKIIYE